MGIKAFVFDCGGVLLRNGDLSAYASWEDRLGLPQGALYRALWASPTWTLAETGKLTDAQLWTTVAAQFGIQDPLQVARLREDLWQTWVLDDKVLALVERLRKTHLVAVMSNATDALEELLEQRYHVADRFVTIVNSARVGIAKPAAGIYQELLHRLQVNAPEVVFVDDRVENITAAAALGMHVVWFVNADDLGRKIELYAPRNGDHGPSPVSEPETLAGSTRT
jgi:HAD superfamily hydrolase (TIGR01509 family)